MSEDVVTDFSKYEDKHGLIQPGIGIGSYNGLLYTSIAVVLLRKHGQDDAALRYILNMKKCQSPLDPGLYNRTPEGIGGQEGPDDYIGICAASRALAFQVVDYGRRNLWNFNNVSPGTFSLKSWLGRQPGLVAHMLYGANQLPGAFRRFSWAVGILLSAGAKPTNQDIWMLSWLLITAFERIDGAPSLMGRLAVAWWDRQLLKKFGPEGLKKLVYLEGNTNHAINRWWIR